MHPAAAWRCALLLCAMHGLGQALRTARGWYNETLTVPCGRDPLPGLLFVKWKYENADGTVVSIATRKNTSVKYESVPEYEGRLSLGEDYALSVARARVADERRLVCVMVTEENMFEEPTVVKVFKEPSRPEIQAQAAFLQAGEMKALGECVAAGGYPEGNLTWFKNGRPLEAAEGAVAIESEKEQDPSSRLYTMRSTLRYVASKESLGAQFTCSVAFQAPDTLETATSEPVVFDLHYPTEKVGIDTIPPSRSFREGDNITLQCTADGNPPPQEFLFYIPGQDGGVRAPSVFTLTDVARNVSGNYKCGLADEATITSEPMAITVHYLDLSLTPSGEVTKQLGDALQVACTPSSSQSVPVAWMKNGVKMPGGPSFTGLQYQDAGNYVCESSLQDKALKKMQMLNLIVEGKPRLKLTKEASKDGKTKTVTCQVEGYPKPLVQWLSSSSDVPLNDIRETDYVNWKFSSKLIISPTENVTLMCIAENKVERVSLPVNVSAISIPEPVEPEDKGDEQDNKVNEQAKLIVGIVVGLLLAALVAGVAYWLYSRKSKSAAIRTRKELGNGEEIKPLEENNHKADA